MTALSARPDVAASRGDVRRAETETRLQHALRTPNLTVGGGYQRVFDSNAVLMGVTVPLPLWNRNQGGVARAAAEEARARHRAAATATAVRLDVQQAANGAETARERVAYVRLKESAERSSLRDERKLFYVQLPDLARDVHGMEDLYHVATLFDHAPR